MSASQSWRLPDQDRVLIDAFKKAGPRSASTRAAVDDVLSSARTDKFTPAEVANALLFLLFSQQSQQSNLPEVVAAVRATPACKNLNWNHVVAAFDIPDLRVTSESFLRLFEALRDLASDDSQFDLHNLWGGVWDNAPTQISFLRAYFETQQITPAAVPRFRASFSVDEFSGVSQEVRGHIEKARQSRYANLQAMKAVFEVLLASNTATEEEDGGSILHDIVRNHLVVFMLSLSNICTEPGNWTPTQERFIEQCFALYLEKNQPNSEAVLEALFSQNQRLVHALCTMTFHVDPRRTEVIYRRAEELGWIDYFLTFFQTPLALDIACLRQKDRPDFDLDRWISKATDGLSQTERINAGNILWKFLRIKADDEYRAQREQPLYQSVPLSLKAVFVFLWKLQELLTDREQIKAAQCTCLTTYPRLMNYGTGFDDVLEKASADKGNKLPQEIDEKMSELFGQMYRSELSIRDMVNEMRKYKTSSMTQLQDLFCCIVHGIFEEYGCYGEYPEEALEKTALLFGSTIKFKLLPPLPQDYGLTLIVDAVKDHMPDSPMHRFGIEALLQISDQLSEWPSLCELLLRIPTLQHPEILQRAQEGYQKDHQMLDVRDAAKLDTDRFESVNGATEDLRDEAGSQGFNSLNIDPPSADSNYKEPDSKSQEKILFVINNLSNDNMSSKLTDVQEVLQPEHFQWFAKYLVEQRARLEPNNQQMYYDLLDMLGDKKLMYEVLRETYVCVIRMMCAKATIDSATERSHLKSLGGWLGSLTLAQDRPIKHRNIYFIDLLMEGYETQRLIVVIPFTCKVLVQGARSVVFKPPNPWLMEIVGVLLELYHFADLKLNLKFEIEVLCKDLGLDHKRIEPSDLVRHRQQQIDDQLTNTSGLENVDEYADLSLNARRMRETFTAQEIMASLPNLEDVLKYPPAFGQPPSSVTIKTVINKAVDRAIQEIIAPVVERSITIASLSTSQLVAKDYSVEPNVDKYRDAARQMVKCLAGSLALVTCKEPLRMSITNYIRSLLEEYGMPDVPEGMILMSVNDNLDIACSLVKEAAEERALPEMDQVIETELEERRRFLANNPNGEYFSQNLSRWATWIPEPYKMTMGGLNEAQRAVYEDFDRRVHGMNAGHAQNQSADSTGRQLPDVLNETLNMTSISTPANKSALPLQSPIAPQDSRGGSALPHQRTNGYPDSIPPHERISLMIDEIQKEARTSSAPRLKDLDKDSSIFQDVRQILIVLASLSRPTVDHVARQTAEKITKILLHQPPQNALEAEFLAFLLFKLCNISEMIVRDVMRWITANEEALLGNSWVTSAFVQIGLMEFSRIDSVIATAMREHNELGLKLLHDMMEQTLFSEEPIALRSDFTNSIVALSEWLKKEPDHPLATELSDQLRAHGVPAYVNVALSDRERAKQDQMRYVFREWAGFFENGAQTETYAKFLRDLHTRQLINSTEDMVTFLRLCIEISLEGFNAELQSFRGTHTTAFIKVDSLALLIILLVKFQGEANGAVKISKTSYFNSILSLLGLLLNYFNTIRGSQTVQRIFVRLISSILHEYAAIGFAEAEEHDEMIMAFGKLFQAIQPHTVPEFLFGWTTLICHRVFVEGMLKAANKQRADSFRNLVGIMLQYHAFMVEEPKLLQTAEVLYRGIWRNMFVLQHDYPEFVCQNSGYFCARIAISEPHLRNIVLAARPSLFYEEPDPLAPGLKVERLEDMKRPPVFGYDVAASLNKNGLSTTISQVVEGSSDVESFVKEAVQAVENEEVSDLPTFAGLTKDMEMLESLVVYLAQSSNGDVSRFDANSAPVQMLSKLVDVLAPRPKFLLLTAIVDQLRYPNTHTNYFCKVILHMWNNGGGGDQQLHVREVILRILCERIQPQKPHPWGVIVLFKELSENQQYGFWELPPFASEPELRNRLLMAARSH